VGFSEQSINIDISSFAFNRTVEGEFKGSYQMMNIYQLDTSVARLDSLLHEKYGNYRQNMVASLYAWKQYSKEMKGSEKGVAGSHETLLQSLSLEERTRAINHALNIALSAANEARMYADTFDGEREYINRHHIEWHRKFTLSVACLLLFLIGAPFGSIVRKGGLGMPLVASVGFFVLYYVIGMIAEKAVRESALGPEGMWISSLVMLPIGIILTLQATTDSSFFDGSSWRKFFGKVSQKLTLLFRRNG
jgi:lipopolysaccharide export system permease protein